MVARIIFIIVLATGLGMGPLAQARNNSLPKKLRKAVVMTALQDTQPKTIEFMEAMVRLKQGMKYEVSPDFCLSLQPQKTNFGLRMQF